MGGSINKPKGASCSYRPRWSDLGWFAHDIFVHPVSAVLILTGKAVGSLRIVTMGQRMHNTLQPTHEELADYVEAIESATRRPEDPPEVQLLPWWTKAKAREAAK